MADWLTPLIGVIFGDLDGTFGDLSFTIRQSVFRFGHFLNVRAAQGTVDACCCCAADFMAQLLNHTHEMPKHFPSALLQVLLSFVFVCISMYFLIVLPVNALMKAYFPAKKTRPCPECCRWGGAGSGDVCACSPMQPCPHDAFPNPTPSHTMIPSRFRCSDIPTKAKRCKFCCAPVEPLPPTKSEKQLQVAGEAAQGCRYECWCWAEPASVVPLDAVFHAHLAACAHECLTTNRHAIETRSPLPHHLPYYSLPPQLRITGTKSSPDPKQHRQLQQATMPSWRLMPRAPAQQFRAASQRRCRCATRCDRFCGAARDQVLILTCCC